MIISNQRLPAVCIRPDHANGPTRRRIKRQDTVVFKKYHRLPGELLRYLQMLLTLHFFIGNIVVLTPVKQPEKISRGERAHGCLRDLLLRHKSLLQCFQQIQIGHAAVDIAAALQSKRRRLLHGVRHHMPLVKVLDGPAVRHEMPLKSPLAAQNILHQRLAAAAWLSVGTVVGAHHSLHPGLLHTGLEGRQIGFRHIFLRGHRIELMAHRLRSGMHRKVLGTGRRLQRVPVIALQSLHIGHAQS